MEKGRIVQEDEPRAVYFRPANEFVASFIGAANLLNGICAQAVSAGGIGPVRLADGETISCVFPSGSAAGRAATVSVRPESIVLSATAPEAANTLRGTVSAASFQGGSVRYDIMVADRMVRVVGPAESVFPSGTTVHLSFPAAAAVSVG
jgi:ABC-type Fe3+/spermidine/putrescine transport system ATPase subunit